MSDTELTNTLAAGAAPDVQARLRVWAVLLGLALLGTLLRFGLYVALMGGDLSGFLSTMCRFDCAWYRSLALDGYAEEISRTRSAQTNWAFFPLYPLLAGSVMRLAGIGWEMAGLLTSTLALVVASACSAPLFGANRRAFWLFAVFLLLGPFSFLASMGYTESLFILLTVLALVALERGNYAQAGFWGALLSATRVTGVLIGAAILVQAVVDARRQGHGWRRLPARLLADVRLLAGLLLTPLGLLAYMLYLRLTVGDGLAFARIQLTWWRELGNPLANWWAAISDSLPLSNWDLESTMAAFVALAVWLVAVMFRSGRIAAGVFCLLCLLLSVAAGVGSSLRFIAGLAPFTIIVAEMISRKPWLSRAAIPLAVVLGLLVSADWMLGDILLV